MITVLFVDDDEEAISPVEDEVASNDSVEIQLKRVGFDEVEPEIITFRPDVIVLDIFSGSPADHMAEGVNKLDQIWEQYFHPIVVYSAVPSAVEARKYHSHPFIKYVEKGSGSELRVLAEIRGFRPLLEALHSARRRFDDEFSKALRDASPLASSDSERVEVVERMARRRMAALIDETDAAVGSVRPWEQYVFPPVTKNLRQGDVLRRRGCEPIPEHYHIVLTPSCDLVASDGRLPKVERVLLARCVDMGSALKRIGVQGKSSRARGRIGTLLSTGFERQIIPFPALSDKIPLMAADVRDLDLLSFEHIRRDYDVVASVDSPFREAIAWAYVQIAARPGLPDRDTESWANQIVDTLGPKSGD